MIIRYILPANQEPEDSLKAFTFNEEYEAYEDEDTLIVFEDNYGDKHCVADEPYLEDEWFIKHFVVIEE